MEQCIRLNDDYQHSFQKTKRRLEDHPEERPFDFSEMYIFGKFNNFVKRLEKLNELFSTIGTYSTMGLSHIEGIDQLHSRFSLLISSLKKKPYDVLDQRRTEFDGDYEDFKRQLTDINGQLVQLMTDHFNRCPTTLQAIDTAWRFIRLKIPAVDVSTMYPVILQCFQRDLEQVQSEYNNKKSSPPIARNIPPVAGRIAWSRQLYQKITKPIKGFQGLPGLIGQSECRRIIKSYNRLAQVLVEYELLHIQLWTEKLPSIRSALTSTVLIRNKGQLFVNFDPQIKEFLREVQILNTMDIEVPGDMTSLYLRKKSLLANYDSVQHLVNEYNSIDEGFILTS